MTRLNASEPPVFTHYISLFSLSSLPFYILHTYVTLRLHCRASLIVQHMSLRISLLGTLGVPRNRRLLTVAQYCNKITVFSPTIPAAEMDQVSLHSSGKRYH